MSRKLQLFQSRFYCYKNFTLLYLGLLHSFLMHTCVVYRLNIWLQNINLAWNYLSRVSFIIFLFEKTSDVFWYCLCVLNHNFKNVKANSFQILEYIMGKPYILFSKTKSNQLHESICSYCLAFSSIHLICSCAFHYQPRCIFCPGTRVWWSGSYSLILSSKFSF